ncbi:MAG: HIT family protein [Xanthomonadales bacterium PRO6]|nr:Protein hit [Xanthomonadales bacterium]MCE7932675.1 HIT family protein [Xanthomonadales bacterium PRO6]
MTTTCTFCEIAAGRAPVSIAHSCERVLAFVDLRQFHPGHFLVIPRAHLHDVRELDDATGAALMRVLAAVTRAVGECFENQGLSLWHSIGPAAFQEVPHLHFHIHPRRLGDGFLRVYPGRVPTSTQAQREAYAARVRQRLVLA